MPDVWWNDDEQLIAALGGALREAEPPVRFVEAGKAAFAWRNVDAELAALAYDSSRGDLDAVAMRTERAPLRAMTFSAAHVSIEIEVGPESVVGQLLPPQPGEIEVLDDSSTAVRCIPVDDVGCFVLRPAPDGRFRLLCRTSDDRDVLTDWVTP